MPGAVFHLTTRTQGHRAFFTPPLRSAIAGYIAEALEHGDAQLLAWAIMPNHLHLVLRQRELPHDRLMQPLLTRVAKLVQRVHRVEGHVFERRYRDRHCQDPDYIRTAIVYTNLNPVRAGLVGEPELYRWTSHAMYTKGKAWPLSIARVCRPEIGLMLFAEKEGLAIEQMRKTYSRWVAWQIEKDRADASDAKGEDMDPDGYCLEERPRVLAGDAYWSRTFVPLFGCPRANASRGGNAPRQDLTEIANRTLAQLSPRVSVEQLRSASKARPVVRARRAVVQRMGDAGYTGRAIAHYLHISPQCVSNIFRSGKRPFAE